MAQPDGDGIHLFWTSILLLAICWLTFITRVGVRIWREALGSDDFLMGVGLVRVQQALPYQRTTTNALMLSQALFTVTSSLCIVCCFYGSGQLAAVLEPRDIMRGTKVRTLALFH
jgi:hypothetical protein